MSSKASAKTRAKTKNKKRKFDNRVYILSIAIITAIFIICLLIAGRYPFGSLPAVKGDGMEQLFTKHVANISEIKKGILPYYNTFNTGGFSNMFAYRIYDITHPWLILKYLVTGKSLILLDYTISLFLNLIMAGVSIIFYLTHRHGNCFDKQDMRLLPISLAYTFCSFNLIMFSYELFKYACFLPFLILGMEQLVYKNKKALYICVLTLTMLYNPYPAFIICEFLVLYFFTMHFENIRDFLKSGARFIAASIAAAGLSAFYLIPAYILTRSSAYTVTDQQSASLFKFFKSFLTEFSDYRMFNKMEAVSPDKGQAAVYCGLIMLFAVPLFALCKKVSLSVRIRRTVLLFILVIAFNNELLNFVLHGFHFQTMVPNRFAMFAVFLLILMLADVILSMDVFTNKVLLGCTFVPSCIFIILYVIKKDIPKASLAVTITFLVLYTVVALACIASRIKSEWMLKCILFISAVEILMNCLYLFPKQLKGESTIISDAEKINSVADKIPDMKQFYNLTEYMDSDAVYYNMGNMTDISTLTFFNSDCTSDMVDRVRRYNLAAGSNNLNYYGGNPLANMMLGVRYHIADNPTVSPYIIYGEQGTYDGLYVYENPNYVSLGFVAGDGTADSVKCKDYADPFEYQNSFSKALGGDEIYKNLNYDYEIMPDKSEFNGKTYQSVVFNLKDNVTGNLYTYAGDEIYYLSTIGGDMKELYFNYTTEELADMGNTPQLKILDTNALAGLHDILSENKMTDIEYKDNRITGTLNTKTDGALYISLPYADTWEVLIDGKEVKTSRFLGGIGVEISAGEHTISMKYKIAGELLGIIISIGTALLLIGFGFLKSRR